MDDIVKDFLVESNENLDRLDQELVKLESSPSSKDLLASIFRTIHTIKGTCAFLGFARLEKLAHAGESLLAKLRDGEITLTAEITTSLLAMVDAIRQMLRAIEDSGQDGQQDCEALIEKMRRLQPQSDHDGGQSRATPESAAGAAPEANPSDDLVSQAKPSPDPAVTKEELGDPSKLGGVLLERGHVSREDLALALKQQEMGRMRLGELLVAQGLVSPEHILAAQQTLETRNPEAAINTIRVDVNLLDRLMNLVGEFVLARNQLMQLSNATADASLKGIAQRLNLIATELQQEVMMTRMQPIATIWEKFPRTVRDMALNCGKEVRLEVEGQDTELDRTLIEAIKDPLMHLIRNAIDHGIELPESRKQAGKPPTGVLKLRAYHEAGQVNIQVSDDGAGLNLELIRKKAVERGILSPQQAAQMPEQDAYNLIFLPGFSTAAKVTKVSGRGVGMDVVKTNLAKISGTVIVHSTPGKGTIVRIKIPLTLAIIPALLVSSAGERFAIPRVGLCEVIRIDGQENSHGLEWLHNAPVYRLRGRLLPLVSLSRELGLASGVASHASYILVVQADRREFGLMVDEVFDFEEIVVKPLGKKLAELSIYSGATILGDGRPALILDLLGVARHAHTVPRRKPACVEAEDISGEVPSACEAQPALLVVEARSRQQLSIPLSAVVRLEEISENAIEFTGSQEVMQYRGEIMPLVRLGHSARHPPEDEERGAGRRLAVVVCSAAGRNVGLIVERIVDIIDQSQATRNQSAAFAPAAQVLLDKVTDTIDVAQVVREAIPALAESGALV